MARFVLALLLAPTLVMASGGSDKRSLLPDCVPEFSAFYHAEGALRKTAPTADGQTEPPETELIEFGKHAFKEIMDQHGVFFTLSSFYDLGPLGTPSHFATFYGCTLFTSYVDGTLQYNKAMCETTLEEAAGSKMLVLDVNNKCHVVGFEEVADNPVMATNSNVAGWSDFLVMANSINTMDKK